MQKAFDVCPWCRKTVSLEDSIVGLSRLTFHSGCFSEFDQLRRQILPSAAKEE